MTSNDDSLFDVESIKAGLDLEAGSIENMFGDDTMPMYGTEKWDDYVMGQFREGEVFTDSKSGRKSVTCAGLRRVTSQILGNIVSSRPTSVTAATDPNSPGRATVVFEIVIDWMGSGELRTFADVADVWHGNTDDLFCAHPAATAATRAEGRALRKALMIKCLAAEELARKDVAAIVRQTVPQKPSDGEWKEDDSISVAQINFIGAKCSQLDVNVMKFVNIGTETYSNITEVSKKTAKKMLGVLNKYQTGSEEIPEGVMGYEENWR